MKALLLSGGLDSTTLAYMLKPEYALTIDYGQNCAEAEIRASRIICKRLKIKHHIITIKSNNIGSGDLSTTKASLSAPKTDWWPFRNQLLITAASAYIITNNLNINEIFFGTLKTDSYHMDGRVEFFEQMNKLLQLQEGNIKVSTPAIIYTSSELIQKSKIELSLLCWAHSCHKSNFPCGNCRGCFKQQNVFKELGYEF